MDDDDKLKRELLWAERISSLKEKNRATITAVWDDEAMVWVAMGSGEVRGVMVEADGLAELFRK